MNEQKCQRCHQLEGLNDCLLAKRETLERVIAALASAYTSAQEELGAPPALAHMVTRAVIDKASKAVEPCTT